MKSRFCVVLFCGVFASILLVGICLFFVMFPYKYKQEVLACSQKYGLQAELVFSVINVESSFKADAVSSAGAMGLMQILPSTAVEVAGKLEMVDFTSKQLFEPDINIEIGCFYLKYLLDEFDGDRTKALCAYNAGLNNVKLWLDDNGNLTNIMYPETKHYVDKVERNLWVYKHFY